MLLKEIGEKGKEGASGPEGELAKRLFKSVTADWYRQYFLFPSQNLAVFLAQHTTRLHTLCLPRV